MKRIIIAMFLTGIFACNNLYARTILVKTGNIRDNKGTILVMAQADKESQPVYGKAEAVKGEVTIKLENHEKDIIPFDPVNRLFLRHSPETDRKDSVYRPSDRQ